METKPFGTESVLRGAAFCAAMFVAGAGGGGELRGQATEGATPLAPGAWRIDADLYARSEDWNLSAGQGGRASSEAWAGTQMGVGVAEGLELRVAWQAYQRDELEGAVTSGAGDVYLSAKWRIVGDEAAGAAWAFMPYAKLPTAGARFADDTVDAGALLIFGAPLGEEGAGYVNAQLGWDDYGDGTGGRDRGASASAVTGRAVGERWTVYAETLASLYPINGDSDSLVVSLGGGLTWAGDGGGTWGADLAFYGGVTRAAADLAVVLRVWFGRAVAPASVATY